MKVLQIGLGNFGKNHLRVWNELNEDLYAADLLPKNLDLCKTYRMQADHISHDYKKFLPLVDVVDIITPTDSHFSLCKEALLAGKDVFVEKPLTSTAAEAAELGDICAKTGRILQVGHLFRYNPATRAIKAMLDSGELGTLRYIYGTFAGFKRMRTDVGVTQTDSVHFFDVVHHMMGRLPDKVTAVQRDTTGRGLEDISVTFLHYPETIVKIESGYHQPEVRRELVFVGTEKTVEADLVKQYYRVFNNKFVKKGKEYTAVHDGVHAPAIKTEEPLRNELISFRECVEKRTKPLADWRTGWETLVIVEAARKSAAELKTISIEDVVAAKAGA
jgi:predicted dehydrogenase